MRSTASQYSAISVSVITSLTHYICANTGSSPNVNTHTCGISAIVVDHPHTFLHALGWRRRSSIEHPSLYTGITLKYDYYH